MNSHDWYEFASWFEYWGLIVQIHGTLLDDPNVIISGIIITLVAMIAKNEMKRF